jgi:hypothetical protein
MALSDDMIRLIDQRIRVSGQQTRAAGTCVDRAAVGPDANVVFDGSTVAMPVKVLGTVFLQPGNRCVLDKYGSDWVVTGSWSAVGLGEASSLQLGPVGGSTVLSSGGLVDLTEIAPITFSKIYDNTFTEMHLTAGCFATVANTRVRFAFRLTAQDPGSSFPATDYNLSYEHFNVTGQHLSFHAMTRALNVPAGSYTVQVRWRRTTATGTFQCDDGDQFAFSLDERIRFSSPFL